MADEQATAISYFLLPLPPNQKCPSLLTIMKLSDCPPSPSAILTSSLATTSRSLGYTYTIEGPPKQSFPGQSILDDPDALWLDDDWNSEDEKLADETFSQEKRNTNRMTPVNDNQSRQWDLFYKRNKANFFKDRHYMLREWKVIDEEFASRTQGDCAKTTSENKTEYVLLEVGCGVGNAMLPLLEESPASCTLIGFELSQTAVDILKGDERFRAAEAQKRAFAYCHDITSSSPFPHVHRNNLSINYANGAMLMFTLSAIEPELHLSVLQGVVSLLKPGGHLFIRDYGWGDAAQYKLSESKGRVLERGFYVKQVSACRH